MARKLLQSELHELFLQDVYPYAENIVNTGKKPLMFRLIFSLEEKNMLLKTTVLIVGYADPLDVPDDGVWVLFELDKHREFAYSANIQIYLRQILQTLTNDVYSHLKHNKETVVLARRPYLLQALEKRFDIDLQIMINKNGSL